MTFSLSAICADVEVLLVVSSAVDALGRPPLDGVRVNSTVELRGFVRIEAPMSARSIVSGPVQDLLKVSGDHSARNLSWICGRRLRE